MGVAGRTISLQAYPIAQALAASGYAGAEADVEWLKAIISALRRVRSELQVSRQERAPAGAAGRRRAGPRARGALDLQLRFLLRLESIDRLDGADAPASAAAVGELRLLVPLEGLVDLDAERARLDKEIARPPASARRARPSWPSSATRCRRQWSNRSACAWPTGPRS